MFEFEEKDNFTLDEVKELVEGFTGQVNGLLATKDTKITELETNLQGFEDLKKSNHELTIKSLMAQEGVSDDLFDLINDEDIELAKNKITLLKDNVTTKTDNTYKPSNAKKDDDYQKAIKDKDVESALKNKLGRLFG